jgi:membrane protease YdiL (CAAX protease family)
MQSFSRLHVTGLLIQCLLGGIAAAVIGVLISTSHELGPTEWLTFALFYAGGGLVLAIRLRRSGIDVRRLFGALPGRAALRLTVVAVPIMALSVAGFWLLFLPLAYVLPGFVRQWGLANANMRPVVTMSAWVLQFLVAVVMAPVVEEVLFRGIILQRWAEKWGTKNAVIASSALFAVGHVELLGHFVFGVAMCALYMRTKSLWVPIATHALNNGIVTVTTLASVLQPTHVEDQMTIESLKAQWWVGPVLLLVGVALLEWYRKRYWAGVDVRAVLTGELPYAASEVPSAA